MKKWLLVLLVVVLSLTSLTACGSGSGSQTENGNAGGKQESPSAAPSAESQKPLEIKFMHIWGGGPSADAVNQIAEKFNSTHKDIKVSPFFVEGSYEGIIEKLQALAVTNQLPEVTLSGFTYTNYMIDNMPLVPLQNAIDNEKMDLSDFFPKMLSLGKGKDGKIYGIPFAVSTPVFYYNKAMFKNAGLDPEKPPTTFDGWREAAQKLTKGDQMGIYFNYSITGNWMFQSMAETMGGSMIAPDEKSVAFNQEPGVKALQYWVDLINKDKTMPNIDTSQAQQSFTSGKLGIFVNTTASLRGLQKDSKFDVGTAVFPVDGVHPRKVPAGGNNIYILKSTPEKEKAAWEFVKYATSTEGTTIVASGMGYMATRQSALDQEDMMGAYLKKNPPAVTTYKQVDDMVPWYNYPGKGGTRIYKILQDNIQAAINLQKTTEQALKDAADEANQLIR